MATYGIPSIPKTESEANQTSSGMSSYTVNNGRENPYASTTTLFKAPSADTVYVSNRDSRQVENINAKNVYTGSGNRRILNTVPGSNFWIETNHDFGINEEFARNLDMPKMIEYLNSTLNLPPIETEYNAFLRTTNFYNRYKIPNPNLALQKGFPHVFFTRPECNILDMNNNLSASLAGSSYFNYIQKSMPDVAKELTKTGHEHDFMFSLSNATTSFSTSDEYINTDTYGRGYTGYKIAFGKSDIESKTANDFTVEFQDDRNMHIYKLIRTWVTYISNVFRGEINVDSSYIIGKILNYVGSAYYIVTAENGEDIIFWSKYYGVFPSTIPSNQYSWASGNAITESKLSVEFKYSFKEDYNPMALAEFNNNAKITDPTKSLKSYDGSLGHSGKTWTSRPFIEAVQNGIGEPFYYKLRFKE